ncbi:MAG: lysophospholipid acyltransferase family protein [Desulfobulbaceae bacterium]|nr:lysophospholipid acyltransferase family protein [Desulfobulbaceae bacterium]
MVENHKEDPIFQIPNPYNDPVRRRLLSPVLRFAGGLLSLSPLESLYQQLQTSDSDSSFAERVLAAMGVTLQFDHNELERLPASGPLVIIANHPFGGLEGIILAAVLERRRPDVRIMANNLLQRIPPLRHLFISIDPFEHNRSKLKNIRGVRESMRWLGNGGALVIFPAGEVSHLQFQSGEITDSAWNEKIARLIRLAKANVVPIFFHGANGPFFQIMGMIHPRLRTVLLPRELANKKNRQIRFRIGAMISRQKIASFASDSALIEYLRLRTYLLEKANPRNIAPEDHNAGPQEAGFHPIHSPPRSAEKMCAEVARLAHRQLLAHNKAQKVYYARADQIPAVLKEIGRLREITFRAAGEGTGKACDLDRFDDDYLHIFIWQEHTSEVVGAYRLGQVDTILEKSGLAGLYTSTLFNYEPTMFERIGPALELGRSWVRPEFQRSYSPLLLLWQGIGHYVVRNPQYRVLFGPVSVSQQYSPVSRQIIAASLQHSMFIPDLARMIKPKTPLRVKPLKIKGCSDHAAMRICEDFDEVSTMIADIELEHKSIPVLLKLYLKLGGKFLAFNVDRHFSNVLDGLVLVDLCRTDSKTLERYMGKEGSAQFLAYHQDRSGRAENDLDAMTE